MMKTGLKILCALGLVAGLRTYRHYHADTVEFTPVQAQMVAAEPPATPRSAEEPWQSDMREQFAQGGGGTMTTFGTDGRVSTETVADARSGNRSAPPAPAPAQPVLDPRGVEPVGLDPTPHAAPAP